MVWIPTNQILTSIWMHNWSTVRPLVPWHSHVKNLKTESTLENLSTIVNEREMKIFRAWKVWSNETTIYTCFSCLVGWLVGWLFKNLKSCLEIGPSLRVGGRARSILALFSLIQLTTSQLYFCVFIYLFIYFITREVCFIKI